MRRVAGVGDAARSAIEAGKRRRGKGEGRETSRLESTQIDAARKLKTRPQFARAIRRRDTGLTLNNSNAASLLTLFSSSRRPASPSGFTREKSMCSSRPRSSPPPSARPPSHFPFPRILEYTCENCKICKGPYLVSYSPRFPHLEFHHPEINPEQSIPFYILSPCLLLPHSHSESKGNCVLRTSSMNGP